MFGKLRDGAVSLMLANVNLTLAFIIVLVILVIVLSVSAGYLASSEGLKNPREMKKYMSKCRPVVGDIQFGVPVELIDHKKSGNLDGGYAHQKDNTSDVAPL